MSDRTIEEVIAELTEITEGVSEDRNLLKAVQTHLTNMNTVFESEWENPETEDAYIQNRPQPLLPREPHRRDTRRVKTNASSTPARGIHALR